jgi:ribosomal protein S18 acetylase RimI-like enzyme
MDATAVVIEHGLADELRPQAAAVFEEAFGAKMRLTVKDADRRSAFMRRAFRADRAIVARDGQRLLGMVGLSTRGEPYAGGLLGTDWDPRPYVELLGWPGAMWAIWSLRMADRRPRPDELYVDGLAVVADARGQGIGTRLLAEVQQVARTLGKDFVRLDVVDTNPRAQALYERLGYRVTRVQSFGWSRRWLGFGAMISMEQPVGPERAGRA